MIESAWKLLRYPGERRASSERFSTPPFALTAQELAWIKAPTLVIWGEKDRLIPVESGHRLAARIRGARLMADPRSGHLPYEARAAETAARAARFLSAAQRGERLGPGSPRGRL
jgi:pimeloyl-ACP methyl ester carboxylesterase